MSGVLRRLRADERGFGMVELVAALSIMSIGILALVAAFNSGALALQRSARVSTATVLAERQLELYRGMSWEQIGLAADSADSLYAANWPYQTAPAAPKELSCTDAGLPECMPIQTVTGPDGRSYRVDTYIVQHAFANQGGSALRPVKVVRVLVRDGSDLSSVLVRQESTFDGELPAAEGA
jgi:prepilin-type N-terminal cleavage/methylation domain-containing protein